jgi:uncharacterized protein YodC (DUF2158 family)
MAVSDSFSPGTLKVGDKVRRLAGGPIMTVESVSATEAAVTWDTGSSERRGRFPISELRKVR